MGTRHGSAVGVVLLAFIAGCGSRAELGKAQAVVTAALEAWKAGETPQRLTGRAIEIAEPDWRAGHRLLDFRLKDASTQPQQGPRVVVLLTLQDRAGKKVTKEVAYEVIFKDGDKVSIGRDAFHVGP